MPIMPLSSTLHSAHLPTFPSSTITAKKPNQTKQPEVSKMKNKNIPSIFYSSEIKPTFLLQLLLTLLVSINSYPFLKNCCNHSSLTSFCIMLTFNNWWGKFLTLKHKLWCTYALSKIHLRWACIQRGSSLIEQSINTQMFSLSTLDLLLPSRLCSRWLLPSSIPIYVPPLLSIRFTVEKEIQIMLTVKRLRKITCNLNVTEP